VGDGTFLPEQRFPLGNMSPDALFAYDTNGNGHLDLVSIAFKSHEVAILLGRGDGTFQSPELKTFGDPSVSHLFAQASGNADGGHLLASANGIHPSRTEDAPESNPPQTFGSGGVLFLTAIAPAGGEDQSAPPGTGESPESAVLLTSFGVAIPLSQRDGQRKPLADVFVVNGPGFPTEAEVLSEPGESQGCREDVFGRQEGNSPPPLSSHLLGETHVGNPEGVDGICPPANARVDESALNGFRILLDGLFRSPHLHGLPGRHGRLQGTPQQGDMSFGEPREREDRAPPRTGEGTASLTEGLLEMTRIAEEIPVESLWVVLLAFGVAKGPRRAGLTDWRERKWMAPGTSSG
jgi:hypothetical protein